jgi:type IV pilus assembly protein PilM
MAVALFGKKKGLVGIDIGSSAIKAVELKGSGKGDYQLVNAGIEVLPPEAIVDGAIMDAGSVVDALQRLVTTRKITTTEVATGLSGNAVIVKKISLPQMSAEELAESIHWEAEQYIPFDIQDVALDYEVLHQVGAGGNMDVLLVAAKKDKIGEYTSAITQAGRTPQVVDIDVFALQNCYEMNYGVAAGRIVALLNLGASTVNVNVLKGGTSVFTRDIAVGGNLYTDAIQKEMNVSFDQAESMKKGAGGGAENVAHVLQSVSENLASEIQKTFDFFKATTSEDHLDVIYIAGGTSKVTGLRGLLAERLETTVELLNPFNNVTYNPRDFDAAVLSDMAPSAAIAVGLALRKVGDR